MYDAAGRQRAIGAGVSDTVPSGAGYHRKPAAPPFKSQERECAACGARFKTTPRRWMLCDTCFRRG